MTSKVLGKILFIGFVGIAALYPFVKETSERNEGQQTSKPDQGKSKQPVKPVVVYNNKHLPKFAEIRDVKEKKRAFFSYLRPYVEQINKGIVEQRTFVIWMAEAPTKGKALTKYQKLLKQYDVDKTLPFEQSKAILLNRMDELPVPLVLMQAANESAWGTSRFALAANNLFGQWCFKPGCGVVPAGRPEGKTYEVRKFNHPSGSVRSYFNNINSGHAYQPLRDLREQLRQDNQPLDAIVLAEGLTAYSTRREEYVAEIQNMIRINNKFM